MWRIVDFVDCELQLDSEQTFQAVWAVEDMLLHAERVGRGECAEREGVDLSSVAWSTPASVASMASGTRLLNVSESWEMIAPFIGDESQVPRAAMEVIVSRGDGRRGRPVAGFAAQNDHFRTLPELGPSPGWPLA